MTYDPARPRYSLPLAGKEYDLLGTFGLIEAVETVTQTNIGLVAVRVLSAMPAHDLARVIHAMLTHCDHKLTLDEVKGRLWETGLEGEAGEALRLHLYGFLQICLAPPGEREGKHQEAGKYQAELRARFRGGSTGKSVSASSDGGPETSGSATPGV